MVQATKQPTVMCNGVCQKTGNRCKNMVAYDQRQSQSFCLVHPPPPPPPLVSKATTTFEQCVGCAVTYGRRCLRKVAKTNPTFPYCHAHIHQRPPVKKVHWKETLVEPSPVPVDVRPVVEEEPIVQHHASAPLQPAVAPLQATPAPIKQKHSEQPSEPSVFFLAMVLILLGVLCSGSPTTSAVAHYTPHTAVTPSWMEAISSYTDTWMEAISTYTDTAYAMFALPSPESPNAWERVWDAGAAYTTAAADILGQRVTSVRAHSAALLTRVLSNVEECLQVGGETAVGAVRSLGRSTKVRVSQYATTLVAAAVHVVRSCDHLHKACVC